MYRVVFTGAPCTGKTEVLNKYKDVENCNIISDVIKKLHKSGIKINKKSTDSDQLTIFKEYIKVFNDNQNYISEGGLVDNLAYTIYLYKKGKVSVSALLEQLQIFQLFRIQHQHVIYCYFPIYSTENDNKVSEQFRKEIDANIHEILVKFNMPFVTVCNGTTSDRMNQINDAMMEFYNKLS